MSLLIAAIKDDNTELVQELLSRPADQVDVNVVQDGKTPLFIACSNGNPNIVILLLSRPEIKVNLLSTSNSSRKRKLPNCSFIA